MSTKPPEFNPYDVRSRRQVALRVSEDASPPSFWRAGSQTVRRLEALEPSALLEVHLGPRNTRYYQEVCGKCGASSVAFSTNSSQLFGAITVLPVSAIHVFVLREIYRRPRSNQCYPSHLYSNVFIWISSPDLLVCMAFSIPHGMPVPSRPHCCSD